MHRQMIRRRRLGRGFALVAVLWLGVALAVGSASFLQRSRAESYQLTAEIETARAVELARSGINLALADLSRPSPLTRGARRDGAPVSVQLAGGEVRYGIQDERGKADLNHARAATVADLLRSLGGTGLDGFDHATLAARLIAETRRARDLGQMTTLDDILARADMPVSLRPRAAEVLTVHSYSARVSARAASPALLATMPGMDAEAIEQMMAARENGETPRPPPSAAGWFSAEDGPIYSLWAEGRTESGVAARMDVMVLADGPGFRSGRPRFRIIQTRVRR